MKGYDEPPDVSNGTGANALPMVLCHQPNAVGQSHSSILPVSPEAEKAMMLLMTVHGSQW